MSVHDSYIKRVIKRNNWTKKWLVSNMHSSKLLTDFSFKNVQLNVILCSDSSIWKNWQVGGQINWFLLMNRLQMSVQAIESLGGHQKGPHEYRLFKRSEHWSILPTYTVDGFITWEVLQGSFTMELFEEFIEFKVLTLIQLNTLLLSWTMLLYISQRYVPMSQRLMITSTWKIFELLPVSSLNFSLLIH